MATNAAPAINVKISTAGCATITAANHANAFINVPTQLATIRHILPNPIIFQNQATIAPILVKIEKVKKAAIT